MAATARNWKRLALPYVVGAATLFVLTYLRQPWPRPLEALLWFSVGFGFLAIVNHLRR